MGVSVPAWTSAVSNSRSMPMGAAFWSCEEAAVSGP